MHKKDYAKKSFFGQFFAVGALLVLMLVFSPKIHAATQRPQVITMTPTSTSPVINPGSVYKGSFQVLNQGTTGYKFLVYATPYRVDGEAYNPEFTVLPTAPNITSWFNFSASGGYVKPGDTATIDYTITIPDSTQPGGYYAAAFAETQYPKGDNGITLNQRVGELFYVQVAGPVQNKGRLLSWQSGLIQAQPLISTLRIENSGGVHFPAKIKLEVKDFAGNVKHSLSTEKEVLPQTIRKLTLNWDKTPQFGLFKVGGTVTYLDKTETLPTKWVLVMSPKVRLLTALSFGILIMLPIARTTYSKRHKKHKKSWRN